MESAKLYREKRAGPVYVKAVKVLGSLFNKFVFACAVRGRMVCFIITDQDAAIPRLTGERSLA